VISDILLRHTCFRNTDCDYSSAYVTIYTDSGLIGHGMTFTIGRGTDIVSEQSLALLSHISSSQVLVDDLFIVALLFSFCWKYVTDNCLPRTIGVPCDPRTCWTLGRTGSRELFREYGKSLGLDVLRLATAMVSARTFCHFVPPWYL
jgi:hypothetical protein